MIGVPWPDLLHVSVDAYSAVRIALDTVSLPITVVYRCITVNQWVLVKFRKSSVRLIVVMMHNASADRL